jgi:hypothetical protein
VCLKKTGVKMITMKEVKGKRMYDLGDGRVGWDLDWDSSLLSKEYISFLGGKLCAPNITEESGFQYIHLIYRDDIVDGRPCFGVKKE